MFSDVENTFRRYTVRTVIRKAVWSWLYLKRQGGDLEAPPPSEELLAMDDHWGKKTVFFRDISLTGYPYSRR